MTDEELREQKEVEHYAASVEAWYTTRLELDKSLLTLSAGGIGLLLTLMSAFGAHTIESLILYILALLCFVVCLGAVLCMFSRNSTHVEAVIHESAVSDPWLSAFDRIAVSSFLAGVIFSLIIGIAGAVRSFENQESSMTTDEKGKTTHTQDSFNRASATRPSSTDPLSKSFNGAVNTRPERPATSQPTTSQGQASQQQSQTSQAPQGGTKTDTAKSQ